ncbi:DUF397 domain-containing protein [Streptomyces carminius]|uniref:DUF397 domain-containing protein n=1 Tax=Streptomyces carminius TaxID=2665496 RepID=A0A2M8M231_9ACTN|nr:DUF397 domain-containing protein [Streptomyces carminius]PJE98250.1 DUF397 domain-containing protein [Streptomyces carminius]
MTLKPSAGDGSAMEWVKSSYSGSDNNDCVEVAAIPGTIHVRDSKDVRGPKLAFTPGAWAGFVAYTAGR